MEWIKCSDRMPEPYQWVLVCNSPKGTEEPRCINIFRWDGKKWETTYFEEKSCFSPTFSDIEYNFPSDEVTHWMPLPDKPESYS